VRGVAWGGTADLQKKRGIGRRKGWVVDFGWEMREFVGVRSENWWIVKSKGRSIRTPGGGKVWALRGSWGGCRVVKENRSSRGEKEKAIGGVGGGVLYKESVG